MNWTKNMLKSTNGLNEEIAEAADGTSESLVDESSASACTTPLPERSSPDSQDQIPSGTNASDQSPDKPVELGLLEDVATNGNGGFLDFPLLPEVQTAIQEVGYNHPTPIQAEVIPHLLYGRDVLAQSQTGSGKTAAFALPILTRVETECDETQVLVLVPTRELAIQVGNSFKAYGNHLPNFRLAVIYGGQDYEIQYRQLRKGPQVIVGTPGRVIDHIKNGENRYW